MDSFCSFPRISELFVRRGADIACDERVHCFSSYVCGSLPCTCNLSNLCIEDSLLVRIDFKCSQHINLLDQQQRCILLSKLLGYLCEKPGCFCILVSLSIQLDSLHLLVLVYQVVGILGKQLLNLYEAVLFSQLDCKIPLVKQHTTINGFFGITKLDVRVHSLLAETH